MLKDFVPLPAENFERGFTLVELLVAGLTSVLIVGTLMITMVFVSKNFKAMQNYTDLDRTSRNAVDLFSRDVRNAFAVVAFKTNSIVFTNRDGSHFSYTWNPSDTTFKRSFTNADRTVVVKTLLTNCETLSFYIYQRNPNPTNTLLFYSTTNISEIKLINVDWKCSRNIMGSKLNTESVQTAQVGLRN